MTDWLRAIFIAVLWVMFWVVVGLFLIFQELKLWNMMIGF